MEVNKGHAAAIKSCTHTELPGIFDTCMTARGALHKIALIEQDRYKSREEAHRSGRRAAMHRIDVVDSVCQATQQIRRVYLQPFQIFGAIGRRSPFNGVQL